MTTIINSPCVKIKLEKVGPYIIGKKLGEGSFGKVMEGLHETTLQKVALKFLHVKTTQEKINLERETRIMKLLNHPNIIRLYQVIEVPESKTTCLAIELANGGEVFQHIVSNRYLSEEESRKFFRQLILALEYCHRNMVIHRDLKPENLLLDENKNIKIMDFGLANLMKIEMLASNCGSPTYCAPEILQSRKYIGPEVDIWSIGCILYAMVTGNCPWPGETLQEQVAYTLKGKCANIPSHVSEECKDLIHRILTVDPKLRPTLAEIQKHPWVNVGFEKLPMEAAPTRSKCPRIDFEIVIQLQGFGFEKDEIVNDILSHKSLKQSYVLYYLLHDQKKRK